LPQDDGYDDYNETNFEHYDGHIYMSPEEEYYLQGIDNHNNLVVWDEAKEKEEEEWMSDEELDQILAA